MPTEVFDKTGTFGRLPALGLNTKSLHNPAMRSLLFGAAPGELPPHHDGMLIVRVEPYSCAAAAGVRAGDILMAIDGAKVSEEGEVSFRGHERLSYEYLITKKQLGDTLTLSLLRNPKAHEGEDDKSEALRSFDINKIAEAQVPPVPVEVKVTLTPTWSLLPREIGKDYTPEYC